MTSLTSTEIFAIVFVVVLAVIVAGLLLYLLRRLKARRVKLLSDLSDRPELNRDRAFNRLTLARREATILAGQGVDLHRALELIAEAQGAFDTRQYDRAYRVAQSAHEALVNARQKGPMASESPLPSRGAEPFPTAAIPPSNATTVDSPGRLVSAAPALPKNRAESQFQLRLLTDELAGLPERRARDPVVVDATALKGQSELAFGKGDYSAAFRLALRGRRVLGGSVESLPATSASSPMTATTLPNGGSSASPDPVHSAEAVAGGERCPDCGYPALAGDAFCRGCGRPRKAMTCPSCGAPRVGNEGFCGRCGARFP